MRLSNGAINGLGVVHMLPDGTMSAKYPFQEPITLFDGRVIEDGDTEPTWDDCLPYQCGADPGNMAARMWCSWHSMARTIPGCVYPECEPFRSRIPGCSLPAVTPAIPPPAPSLPPPVAVLPPPPIPTLTPANIVQPLPDITRVLAPNPATVPSCSPWCAINGWIADNPLMAAAILAGATFLLMPKGAR